MNFIKKILNTGNAKTAIVVFVALTVVLSILFRFIFTPLNNRLSNFFNEQTDNQRIASLEKIDTSLKSMGENVTITRLEKDYKIIYTSLPAKQKDCSDLKLPALLEGWEYRCRTDKDYRNSNGTGWLPVNFTVNGKKIIDKLPVHPINSEEMVSFYFFIYDKSAKDGYTFGDGFQLSPYLLSSTETNNENKESTASAPDLTSVKEAIKKLGTVRGKYVPEKANKDDKNPVSPSKLVFLSASSADTKCSDLNLPALTKGWEYRCVTNAKSRNIDGTGWIPLDFYSDLLKRSIKELPVPNTNNEYQALAFIMDSDNSYFLGTIPDDMLHIRSRQTALSDETINATETRDTQAIVSGIKTVGGVNENLIDNLTTLVYISLPSDKEDCSDLRDGLPSLPDGWEYRCAAKNNYKKADGTGWLPVDLTRAKSKLSELPTDETKNKKDLRYYAFVSDQKYALATAVKSKNILKNKIGKDQAYTPNTFVLGNSPKLWSDAVGLVAWWPMDEGDGDIAQDKSGHGFDAKLTRSSMWIEDKLCIQNKCLGFNGKDDKATFSSPFDFSNNIEGLYSFYFNIKDIPTKNILIFNPGTSRLDVNIEGNSGKLFVWFHDSKDNDVPIYKSEKNQFIDEKWHHIIISKNNKKIEIYIDGKSVAKYQTSLKTNKNMTNGLIMFENGSKEKENIILIDDVKIYKTTKSIKELFN